MTQPKPGSVGAREELRCIHCGEEFRGLMIGAGDGTGQKFAHRPCLELAALRAEVERLKASKPFMLEERLAALREEKRELVEALKPLADWTAWDSYYLTHAEVEAIRAVLAKAKAAEPKPWNDDPEVNALVAHLTRNADKNRTPCRCSCGTCPVLLTMPSEWDRGTCIFCRDGEHPKKEPKP